MEGNKRKSQGLRDWDVGGWQDQRSGPAHTPLTTMEFDLSAGALLWGGELEGQNQSQGSASKGGHFLCLRQPI